MKLVRINLKTKAISDHPLKDQDPYYYYAGRALSSKIIAEEVTASCDPLSENNKLIFSSGFLGGTTAPNSGRISVGCKSPLTHGVKEANVGGRAPAYLSRLNIRALIFEEKSPEW